MADPSSKSIPDWQKTYLGAQSKISSETNAPTETAQSQDEDSSLLENAKRWLSHEAIKNATRVEKVSFLEKKGLQGEDIQQILDSTSNPTSGSEIKTVHDSASPSNKPTHPTPPTNSPPGPSPTPVPQSTSNRDIPPIITYPEFLLRPQKPPPLVTFQRFAYATYAFAGLATLTYGASKYLVQPMLDSLTSARHDLADTALTNLETLNSVLESSVSHVPYTSSTATHNRNNPDSDASSITSDPTELFHRDIGVQTSPPGSPTPSHSHLPLPPKNATQSQSTRLRTIHASLTSLSSDLSSTDLSNLHTTTLKSTLSDFQTYLEALTYPHSDYNNRLDYESMYASTTTERSSGKSTKDPDDAGDKFKAEIRSIKGALLSSRNFPSGRPPPAAGAGVGVRQTDRHE